MGRQQRNKWQQIRQEEKTRWWKGRRVFRLEFGRRRVIGTSRTLRHARDGSDKTEVKKVNLEGGRDRQEK